MTTTTASLISRYYVDDDQHPTLNDLLRVYGDALRQPGGWRWLAGYLHGDALQYARQIIEAKYGTTTPAPVEVERPQYARNPALRRRPQTARSKQRQQHAA